MKNCKSLLLACLVTVLVLPLAVVGDASAQNLLTNPGFETGDLTGWNVFGISGLSNVVVQSGDNGPSAPGTNVAFLENNAEGIALTLKQSTPAGSASGAGTATYSFDLLLGGAGLGGVFFVEVFAEQANGGVIAGSGVLGNYTPGNWTNFSGAFAVPANTDFLTIQLSAITGAVVGGFSTMYADNVSLEFEGVVSTDETTWGNMKALYR
jgi:hypothetical protein